MTEEELRALGDPWVDWYLTEQARLDQNKSTANLMHMAESYGRPGSMTMGGQKYRAASLEREVVDKQLIIYCMARGYLDPAKLNLGWYDENQPPKQKVSA